MYLSAERIAGYDESLTAFEYQVRARHSSTLTLRPSKNRLLAVSYC